MGRGRTEGKATRPFLRGSRREREEETAPSFFQGLRRGGQGKRRHSLSLGTCVKRGQRGGRGFLLRTCARGARGELRGPFFGARAWGRKGKEVGAVFLSRPAMGEARGRDGEAFPSRPVLGEAGERWIQSPPGACSGRDWGRTGCSPSSGVCARRDRGKRRRGLPLGICAERRRGERGASFLPRPGWERELFDRALL